MSVGDVGQGEQLAGKSNSGVTLPEFKNKKKVVGSGIYCFKYSGGHEHTNTILSTMGQETNPFLNIPHWFYWLIRREVNLFLRYEALLKKLDSVEPSVLHNLKKTKQGYL